MKEWRWHWRAATNRQDLRIRFSECLFVLLSFKIKAQDALTSLGIKSLPGVLVLNSDDQSVMAIDISNGTVPEILRAVREPVKNVLAEFVR